MNQPPISDRNKFPEPFLFIGSFLNDLIADAQNDREAAEKLSSVSDFDVFQYWLMAMDERLDWFRQVVPSEIAERLDQSLQSVDVLEQVLLSRYKRPEEIHRPGEKIFLDAAARYLGEIIRTASGARWQVELTNRNEENFRLPVLRGGSLQTEVCPQTLLLKVLKDRTGQVLQAALT
jgi:hypothetical protein